MPVSTADRDEATENDSRPPPKALHLQKLEAEIGPLYDSIDGIRTKVTKVVVVDEVVGLTDSDDSRPAQHWPG